MELKKVMKKGLSVVLSAAMVLTSMTVGSIKADAQKASEAGNLARVAENAEVTKVTMTEPEDKNIVVKADSMAATASAVFKVEGTGVDSLTKDDVAVSTKAEGVTADLSKEEAGDAQTAIFKAVVTVPANAATGKFAVDVAVTTQGGVTVFDSVGTLSIEEKVVDKTEENEANVTKVIMAEPEDKNVVVTASSAAVTAAAVLRVDGTNLGLVTAKNGVTAVTTAAGVKVDVSTSPAVAATASSATLAAVVTVPANAATGVYPIHVKVATNSAAATTFESVGTLTIKEATQAAATVPEEPVVKATKSIKLAVKKAEIGVKETLNVKVTVKKTASASAAKKVSVSKNSKKKVASAVIKGKKLVIKGKKAGTTKITVKSGKKTAVVTVTVKKAPKSVSLKDGKRVSKKLSLIANTKKKAVKKTYTIVLPKKSASYGYSVKTSGKKAVVKSVTFMQNKKGVTNKVVVTLKKGAKGNANIVLTSNANKKAKASIKVTAVK